ncbi:hypothetical protein GCM10008983_28170 [Lentibacillus halophilus]|uniref:Uncharacterized protein n=1 Tax=Lentibacillus halophilus TaxID=295065 RepID=A0ABP3JEH9_9BACI
MTQSIQKAVSSMPMLFMFFAFYLGVSVEKYLSFVGDGDWFFSGAIFGLLAVLFANIGWFLGLAVAYYFLKMMVIDVKSQIKKEPLQ